MALSRQSSTVLLALLAAAATQAAAFQMNRYTYERSIVHHGDLSLFVPLSKQLSPGKASKCLHFVAIGGSVTCEAVTHKHANFSYPDYLVSWFNQKFPCSGSHSATVRCQAGQGAEFWIDEFAGRHDALLDRADVVLVDSVLNDGLWDIELPRQRSDLFMTTLLQKKKTSSTDQRPTTAGGRVWRGLPVIWLVPAGHIDAGGYVSASVAEMQAHVVNEVMMPVVRHHGVPYLNVVSGVVPFNSDETSNWFTTKFIVDGFGHPGDEGQMYVADVIGTFITEQALAAKTGMPWQADGQSFTVDYVPKEPMIEQDSVVMANLGGNPIRIDAVPAEDAPASPDWKWVDCKGGWRAVPEVMTAGLQAEFAPATCSLWVSERAVAEHLQAKLLHIRMLKSPFAPMGRVTIEVFAGKADTGKKVAEMTVDAAWKHPVQVSDMTPLSVPEMPDASEMTIKFTIISSEPARRRDRIKLYSVTLL